MKYTEQLFDGIFDQYLKDAKERYLKGKISYREIAHFAKHFAVEFYNEKTKHIDFIDKENNYNKGFIDAINLLIDRIDCYKDKKQSKLLGHKATKRPLKKAIERIVGELNTIVDIKLIVLSILKHKRDNYDNYKLHTVVRNYDRSM